jgi:hypothetical protein
MSGSGDQRVLIQRGRQVLRSEAATVVTASRKWQRRRLAPGTNLVPAVDVGPHVVDGAVCVVGGHVTDDRLATGVAAVRGTPVVLIRSRTWTAVWVHHQRCGRPSLDDGVARGVPLAVRRAVARRDQLALRIADGHSPAIELPRRGATLVAQLQRSQ